MDGLSFPINLVTTASPRKFQDEISSSFKKIEEELLSMKVSYELEPSSDSLIKLYEMHSKGRAYFERASEIYRSYLKVLSKIGLLNTMAKNKYKAIYSEAQQKARADNPEAYKMCKSGDERQSLIESYIPESLKEELVAWDYAEQLVKTQFTIIKSYKDSFESIRQDVLVQLSVIKQLIALGGLSIDPEAMRALNIINSSYNASFNNRVSTNEEAQEFDEGTIEL